MDVQVGAHFLDASCTDELVILSASNAQAIVAAAISFFLRQSGPPQ